MATKTDFTADEWTQLLRAPGWASIAVAAASPSGPLGLVKEMFAAGKVIADAKVHGGQNGLVEAVVAELTSSEGRHAAQPTEVSGKSPDEVRAKAVAALAEAAALLDRKAGADALPFKQWLAAIATKVAEAAKEGGFLGIGGVRVSEAEARTLTAIRSALGVSS